jgi:hypothetical protein
LIVGAAARTDLLGDDRTVELAHAQYQSLQRLSALPDPTALWPTHGAGSFCSAPPGTARTSAIGAVVDGEPALAALTAEQVRAQAASGAVVIDVRPIADVAKGHAPGSVSIALRPQFATWLGWVIQPGTPSSSCAATTSTQPTFCGPPTTLATRTSPGNSPAVCRRGSPPGSPSPPPNWPHPVR